MRYGAVGVLGCHTGGGGVKNVGRIGIMSSISVIFMLYF